jgi:hypothetical protein
MNSSGLGCSSADLIPRTSKKNKEKKIVLLSYSGKFILYVLNEAIDTIHINKFRF